MRLLALSSVLLSAVRLKSDNDMICDLVCYDMICMVCYHPKSDNATLLDLDLHPRRLPIPE